MTVDGPAATPARKAGRPAAGEGQHLEFVQEQAGGANIEVIQPEAHPEAPSMARVARLQVVEGPATQMVKVVDAEDRPVAGIRICRWWPGAPEVGEFPAGCHATRYQENFVNGPTNENGDLGFGMGTGDMPGSSGVWLADCDCPGGAVFGLGWKPGTNHASIAVTFRVVPSDYVPPEAAPAGEGVLERLVREMVRIADAMERAG